MHSNCISGDSNKHSAFCAYVTFKESKSAYFALKEATQNRKLSTLKILPADTWRQLTAVTSLSNADCSSESLSFILNIDDDSLLEIFYYLDLDALIQISSTCSRFYHLIHQHIYPRYKAITLNFNRNTGRRLYRKPKSDEINVKPSTLADMRNKLLAVGPYVTNVKLMFPEDIECYPKNLTRIIDIFTQLIGKRIESLTILGIALTERMQLQFRPIFERLKYLEWHSYDFIPGYECDLVNTCKNLETLKISHYLDFGVNVNQWQNLQNVSLNSIMFLDNPVYVQFLQNNRQIKTLRFTTFEVPAVLANISTHITGLEKLVVQDHWRRITASSIAKVTAMKNLKTLKLLDVHEDFINEIIEYLRNMPQLNYIKITFGLENFNTDVPTVKDAVLVDHEYLIQLAQYVRDLKRLVFRKFRIPNETVLKFIQKARSIQELDFRECAITITKEFIEDIHRIMESRTIVLNLIIDQTLNEETANVVRLAKIMRVLNLSASPVHYKKMKT